MFLGSAFVEMLGGVAELERCWRDQDPGRAGDGRVDCKDAEEQRAFREPLVTGRVGYLVLSRRVVSASAAARPSNLDPEAVAVEGDLNEAEMAKALGADAVSPRRHRRERERPSR